MCVIIFHGTINFTMPVWMLLSLKMMACLSAVDVCVGLVMTSLRDSSLIQVHVTSGCPWVSIHCKRLAVWLIDWSKSHITATIRGPGIEEETTARLVHRGYTGSLICRIWRGQQGMDKVHDTVAWYQKQVRGHHASHLNHNFVRNVYHLNNKFDNHIFIWFVK